MERDAPLMPVFQSAEFGADESYDTLDDIDTGGARTVQALYEMIATAVAGAVGVCIVGNSALCDPRDSYWGRAILIETGEYIQMRVCPRGSAARRLEDDASRFIATRRTSINSVPVVASVVLFLPRYVRFTEGSTPLTCGSTIGCRGVHVLLPSLFNKHASRRDPTAGYASFDPEGFHSVRPATICVSTRAKARSAHDEGCVYTLASKRHRPGPAGVTRAPHSVCASRASAASGLRFSTTPGYAYLTIAAQMFGVDLPDPLTRPSDTVSDYEHSRQVIAKQRRIVKAVGECTAATAIASSLTITDVLSVEGLCGLLCNQFFQGMYGSLEPSKYLHFYSKLAI